MSDWYLTPEHQRLRHEVRAFAETEIAPRVAAMEQSGAVEHDLAHAIARQGWIAATIDTLHGGMGAGHLAKTIIIEELSRTSAAMGAMVQASQLGVAKVVHFGTQQQKRFWLPRFADGSCLPTIAVTEPVSGSHVLGMETTAVRDGDAYVLTGRKTYVGNSHIAHVHGVVARTAPGSRGLTAFLVEANRPGLTLLPYRPTLGLRGFSFGELLFEQCRIPAGNRLGDEGDGRDVAYSSSVLYGRPNLTAVSLGIHQAILDEVVRFSSDRLRYGKPLHHLTNIKLKIGQITSRLMTARLAAYHAAHLLDTGVACDSDLMNAKLINAESAMDSARAAMEIEAAAGLTTDRPLERYLRDAHHIYAPAGTSDIQLLRLAESALGLDKGQWSRRLAMPKSADQYAAASGLTEQQCPPGTARREVLNSSQP
ncbi:acyl-CoA dehydrogenase family protein [Actinacidiphila glaucinigra]|uniref:Acyl-CoA dehydrogenase n=1 Tax=Actinacidiphila glaucinigra TaxID=235986 RepID=A0A239LSV0_9ACTN|nr:acyl-CoA dehydrogenase family protein [Actinacidiphila glaucinigra]SNT33445.1 Acyl-CoA dehydrogenase [Actinacidiphila glaucinigra]